MDPMFPMSYVVQISAHSFIASQSQPQILLQEIRIHIVNHICDENNQRPPPIVFYYRINGDEHEKQKHHEMKFFKHVGLTYEPAD